MEPTPKHRTAGECAEAFVQRALRDATDRGTWLVIAGRTGSGKSHLARRIRDLFNGSLIHAQAMGWMKPRGHLPGAAFARWELRSRCHDGEWQEWSNDVSAAILTIVDDVGAETDEFKSGKPIQRLKEILDLCERKWLLITTNVEPSNWRERFGVRVADRLMSAKRVTLFDVESWRMNQGREVPA